MAAMTTPLTVFADNGNTRTYVMNDHTVLKPRLVIQKRRVPSGSQTVQEDSVSVISATPDALGAILPQKVSFEVKVKRPTNGTAADTTAMLAVFRDVVNGDEFATMVNSSLFIK